MSENIKNFSVEWNKSNHSSSVQPFKEEANQSLQNSTSRTLLPDRQIPEMFKYVNLISKINKNEVKECLDFLRNTYPLTERFSLFYHKEPPRVPVEAPHLIKPLDVPLEMQPADGPLQIQPVNTHPQPMDINSGLSSIEKFLSKESLKKIIETTSSDQLADSNSQQSKASDTSHEGGIFNPPDISNSFKPSDGAQTFISSVTCELNINIKSEPVSYGEVIPPVPCPFNSSDSISNKRPIFEADEQVVKKIKIEPKSPIKQTERDFCEQSDERCLVNEAASSVSCNMFNPLNLVKVIPPVPCTVNSSDSSSNNRPIFEADEQVVKKIKIEPKSPIKQTERDFCEQSDERCLVNQAASSVSCNMFNPLNLVKDTPIIDNKVPKEFPSQFSRIAARFSIFDESNEGKLTNLNNDLRLDGNLSRANLSSAFTCNVNIDIRSHSPSANWENDAVEMKISAAEAKKKMSSKPFDLRLNKYKSLDCASNNLIQPTVAVPSTSFSSNESGNDFAPKHSDNSQVSRNVQILRKAQQNPSLHPSSDLISRNLASIPSESFACKNTLTNALNPILPESSNDTKNPKTLNHSNNSRPLQSNAFKPTSSSVLHGKNCNQKIPDASDRDQTSSSVLHQDDIGKKFIETKDLSPFILKWRVEWLVQQEKIHSCPRFFSRNPRVNDSYKSVLEYYNTYLPLHILHLWLKIFHCWWTTKVLRSGVFEQIYDIYRQNLVVLICTLSLKRKEKMPKLDDFLICKFKSGRGSFTEFFGRVLIAKVFDDYPKSASFERPDLLKMELHIECESSHGISLGTPVELQILINLRIPLIQNDALKNISSMRPLVLNPKDPDCSHLSEIITVQPFDSSSKITSNIDVIWRSVQSHSVSVVCTPSPDDSTKAVNYVLQQLISKTSFPLLVCFKDEQAFYQLANSLKDRCSLILAIKEDEVSRVPPYLEGFLAARQDPATDFHSHSVVLILVSAAFFGGLEDRLENNETRVTCVFHEAQNFLETESALFMRYNVQRLLMLGHLSRKTEMPSFVYRWRFDVSLFERFFNETKNVQ